MSRELLVLKAVSTEYKITFTAYRAILSIQTLSVLSTDTPSLSSTSFCKPHHVLLDIGGRESASDSMLAGYQDTMFLIVPSKNAWE